MAAILGVSGLYHDAAAALVVDGNVVCAIQEERLSRIKNDPSLPRRAIQACLTRANIPAAALDAVIFYEQPFVKLERVMLSLINTWPKSMRQFSRSIGAQLGDKIWVIDQLAELLDLPRKRISSVPHHRSHAASAFFPSPFSSAAVVVADAVGEKDATSIWRGHGSSLEHLASLEYPHSIGLLYAALTAYLGFAVNEGEYKVMGLAAFGTPRFTDEFARIMKPESQGSYYLDTSFFADLADADLAFGPKLETLLGPRREPGRPWDMTSELDRRYADIASTVQLVTEEALLGVCRRARELTGSSALCLAGGVALNCVANRRLLLEAGFDRVFVQPAAGDAGGALGAALLGAIDHGDGRPRAAFSAALGITADVDRAEEIAQKLGIPTRRVNDAAREALSQLERDRIVAVVSGRSEWGPRALGQRSILALPRQASTRERLNRVIKQREPFRPFAPAVLSQHAASYFPQAPNDMTPFMTTISTVAEDKREALAAVTHVDQTARVQTVEAGQGLLGPLLELLLAEGKPPILLNTSLNGPGEPIVASAEDAISFFSRHPIDTMLIENLVLERRTS